MSLSMHIVNEIVEFNLVNGKKISKIKPLQNYRLLWYSKLLNANL